MEEFRNLIKKDRPNIKESSIAIYYRNLKKINNNKDFKNFNFLKDVDKVLKYIQQKNKDGKDVYKQSSQKIMLASILVALRYNDKFEKEYNKYLELTHEYSKKYYDDLKKHMKTERQSDNWVSLNDLTQVLNHYIRIIKRRKINKADELDKKDRDILQKYLVASLYLLIPPRRNLYADVKIISEDKYDDLNRKEVKENNYLVIKSRNKKYFSFGDYKTNKKYGVKLIDIPSKLNSVLNLWLKHNKDKEYLLYNKNGSKMRKNALSKYINKVFSITGKDNISSTLLRHIYISDKIDIEEYNKMKKLADAMGHDIKTQNDYNKKD